MVEVGDRVLVESETVGTVTRGGVVMAVEGRLITVRWDSGSESVFVPSAGSLRVTGRPSLRRPRRLTSFGAARPCGGRCILLEHELGGHSIHPRGWSLPLPAPTT